MDAVVSLGQLAGILSAFGPIGLLVVIWYVDIRTMRKMISDHREETAKILSKHRQYMDEIRRMYEANADLVRDYNNLSSDLREVVIMCTQAMQRMTDDINRNQYCPMQRVDKREVAI